MENIRTYLDATMCLLWIVTYTLVLIGTVKYKYPLIPSSTQLIIAPFEFSMWLGFIIGGGFSINYVTAAYSYWTIIEIAIIYVVLKISNTSSESKWLYLIAVCTMTCIMYYLAIYKGWMFFFSYFNTFVGEIFWLIYFHKKDYPIKPIVLIIFIAKCIGDAISIPVYFGRGIWIISLISILLPTLDILFILAYIKRKKKNMSITASP
ncbi:MAG: hypothetical protein J6J15_03540 [Oscillospiraceae bacterium]|nr:hypothetical protein [Oscillospiraceae bacterium]